MKPTLRIIVPFVLLGVALATWHMTRPATPVLVADTVTSPVPAGFVRVARVIDGDTIEIADGERVRYLGMDTPETVNPKKPVQCYGPEASARNHALLDGQSVRLVRDVEDTDMYGRLLRYVYLPDGTFVNMVLVAEGYARVYTWPPNIAHTREFQAAQAQAKAAGLGLWGACQ
ncbi:MAG TPA: thermonuclease family protein [Candidatus Paceibacterota bacterium]|nr:thermonuclease family protein [Candidatus Paceibacterota bacterium]